MPNLASVLKTEIRRLARSEARALVAELRRSLQRERKLASALRKTVARQEREIADLRRQIARGAIAAVPPAVEPGEAGPRLRFRKETISAIRRRHGLSQASLAKLVGVGLNTVWSWEKGKSTPRRRQLAAIAELRSLGKKEMLERLASVGLESGRKKPGRKPGSAVAAGKKRVAKKKKTTKKKSTKKKATRKTVRRKTAKKKTAGRRAGRKVARKRS
ncbi:MAG: XRE family transcriptional regulator [Planctomycetota bacterium]|nr:MAG: XRE family transcriptional regulator [Planctomycetota bacterium]